MPLTVITSRTSSNISIRLRANWDKIQSCWQNHKPSWQARLLVICECRNHTAQYCGYTSHPGSWWKRAFQATAVSNTLLSPRSQINLKKTDTDSTVFISSYKNQNYLSNCPPHFTWLAKLFNCNLVMSKTHDIFSFSPLIMSSQSKAFWVLGVKIFLPPRSLCL